MRSHKFVRGHQHLILASLAAATGVAFVGCSSAPDTDSEHLGEAQQAATVCLTIQRGLGPSVVRDAYINQAEPSTRYGTEPDMNVGVKVGTPPSIQRSLLYFDVSAVPAGATVTSADVTVVISSASADEVRLHRATTPWTESTASYTLNATAFDSAVDVSWASTTTGSRTFSIASLAQGWVNTPSSNAGMLLESSAGRTTFKTSEASADRRPKLVICYDDGTGASTSTSSSASSSSASSSSASSSSASSSSASSSSASSSSSSGTGGGGGAGGGGGGYVPGTHVSCASNTLGAGNNCGTSGTDNCCTILPVPGGTFNRLNDASYPATVSGFNLDKYQVTVGRFRQYIEATGGPTQASPPPSGAGAHPLIPNSGWDPTWNTQLAATTAALKTALVCDAYGWPDWSDTPGTKEKKPIVCATWLELFGFCAWDGGRLPTQAEMNYASAGGSEQRYYPWPSTTVNDIALNQGSWCCQGDGSVAGACLTTYPSGAAYPCAQTDLTNVGSFPAGAGRWGHLDLAGNAYKVTRDGSDNYNPLTPCNNCARLDNTSGGRVTHGGSFLANAFKQGTPYRAGYGTTARRYYISVTCAGD